MPISSQVKRRSGATPNIKSSSQFVWRSSAASSSENLDVGHNNQAQVKQKQHPSNKRENTTLSSTFQVQKKDINQGNKKTIKQISQPNSCATTSMALNNRLATEDRSNADYQPTIKSPTLSLAGQLILAGKQPASLEQKTSSNNGSDNSNSVVSLLTQPDGKAPTSLSLIGASNHHNHHYKYNNNQHQADFYLSRSSLNQHQHQPSQASSTTQLQPNQLNHNHNPLTSRLPSIRSRNMNLKYVKTLIIILMSIDLLMTIFLHQFASQDQMQIWLTSYKMRFSLLNLVLSAIWFVVLSGAILFDVHFILVIACIVDVGSFMLLLVLSIIHFYKKIDYNTVQLTSLLALLFSIIFLHVYLLAMSALTIYLTGAVKRRHKRSTLSTVAC